jgi:para-nitrobenzyl esterase
MKKLYQSMLAVLALATAGSAQTTCNGGRYSSDVYTNVTTATGITYGSNTNYLGNTQSLTLDIYQATGDTSVARPLIIWVHGGSFIGGTSADVDVSSLSSHFAKKGFVCASINYRLGMNSVDSTNAIYAVIRAVQDVKAAVRFFRKDRAITNTYKIDTANIFIGGSSAGAIAVLHAVYLKRDCQIYPYINAAKLAQLGGLNGTSGNPGYSNSVKGVISLCGALATYGLMEVGDVPLCSMHGTADQTVIYGRGVVNPGVALMYLDGSRVIYKQATTIGVQNNFYTFVGAKHVPYAGNTTAQLAYMDTTVNFVRDYVIGRLGCTNPALQPADAPFGTATLYAYNPCVTGIETYNATNLLNRVFPNPSNGNVNLVFTNNNATHTIELSDMTGKLVASGKTSEATYVLEKGSLNPGVYFLKVSNTRGDASVQKIVFY